LTLASVGTFLCIGFNGTLPAGSFGNPPSQNALVLVIGFGRDSLGCVYLILPESQRHGDETISTPDPLPQRRVELQRYRLQAIEIDVAPFRLNALLVVGLLLTL
jgi:hypothetical protein